MVTVRSKFDTLQEISETHTPNEEYENFVSAHMKAAVEHSSTKPRAEKSSIGDNVKTAFLSNKRNPTNTNMH